MASLKLVCAIVLCMVVIAPMASEAAFTCDTVTKNLVQCLSYLQGSRPLTQGCCNGVTALNNAAKTTADRQAACECIKTAAKSVSGINQGNAASLPGKCGVNIPYKISTTTNCKNVK